MRTEFNNSNKENKTNFVNNRLNKMIANAMENKLASKNWMHNEVWNAASPLKQKRRLNDSWNEFDEGNWTANEWPEKNVIV